jgi:hypothetical protein
MPHPFPRARGTDTSLKWDISGANVLFMVLVRWGSYKGGWEGGSRGVEMDGSGVVERGDLGGGGLEGVRK